MAIFSRASVDYQNAENELEALFRRFPGSPSELVESLPLFISNYHFNRILFLYECYKMILEVPGEIHLFGVRFGRGMATVDNFRGLLEPLNGSRLIVGYDTFEGILDGDCEHDGDVQKGELATPSDYSGYLSEVLAVRNELLPMRHIRQFALEPGDAVANLEKRLSENPATCIAMAHLDMNVFSATEQVIKLMKPHLVKGSLLIFDEFGHPNITGPTLAARATLEAELSLKRVDRVNTSWAAVYTV